MGQLRGTPCPEVAPTKVVFDRSGDGRGDVGRPPRDPLETSHSTLESDARDDRTFNYRPCPVPARAPGPVSPDLLRSLLTTFINTVTSAAVCGEPCGQASLPVENA